MAGSMTTPWARKVLDYIFRDVSLGLHATNLYIGLFITVPAEDGTGSTEVTGTAYARQIVVRSPAGSSGWNASTNTDPALTDNSGAVNFPVAGSNWGTVTGFGIFNSLAGAVTTDCIFWGDLTQSKTINSGDTATFAAGSLDVTLD